MASRPSVFLLELCLQTDSSSLIVSLNPWPHIDVDQIDAATRVLASGKLNTWTGDETSAFETDFAEWCGSRHAIAMANGSLALSAAYLAVGLGRGMSLTTPLLPSATASVRSSLVLSRYLPMWIRILARSIPPLLLR